MSYLSVLAISAGLQWRKSCSKRWFKTTIYKIKFTLLLLRSVSKNREIHPTPGRLPSWPNMVFPSATKRLSRSPKRNLTNRITSSAWIIKTSIISTGWPRLQIDERFFFAIILFLARKELIFRILGLITNSIEHTGNCRKPCQNGWIKLKHN